MKWLALAVIVALVAAMVALMARHHSHEPSTPKPTAPDGTPSHRGPAPAHEVPDDQTLVAGSERGGAHAASPPEEDATSAGRDHDD